MMIIYVSARPGIDATEIQELPGAFSISLDLPFVRRSARGPPFFPDPLFRARKLS